MRRRLGRSTASRGHARQSLAHHLAQANTSANTSRQASPAAGVLGRIAQRVGGLQLGVSRHIQHTHGAQFLCRLAGWLEVFHVEALKRQADGRKIIRGLCAHARTQLLGQADQLRHRVLGSRLAQQVLQLREQHRAQASFDIISAEHTLRTNDLGHKLLRVLNLEAECAKPLQQRHTQAHARIAYNDWLGSAPLLVGKLAHRNKVNLRRERRAVAEYSLTDLLDQQGDVQGGNRVAPRAKSVQSVPVAEEHSHL